MNGTAPEECSPQMKKLRTNPMQNTTLGKKVAVCGWGREAVQYACERTGCAGRGVGQNVFFQGVGDKVQATIYGL